jgi:hypothetical protein
MVGFGCFCLESVLTLWVLQVKIRFIRLKGSMLLFLLRYISHCYAFFMLPLVLESYTCFMIFLFKKRN